MDTEPEVMQSVLSLIYRGRATLSTQAVEELKSIVKMLGLTFPGGFERVIMSKGDSEPPEATPISTVKSVPIAIKRPHHSPPHQESKKPRPSPPNRPTLNLPMSSKPTPVLSKASATDRMNMHVSMTLQLKDAPSGTTATCKMPNCGAEVTYEQLSDHFLVHETSDRSSDTNTPISFPCVPCGVNFKFRRELESHTKNKHGGGLGSMRDKMDLLSDSDSSSDEDTFDPPAETTSAASAKKSPVSCPQCNNIVPSPWHLHPSKHECLKALVSPLVIKRPIRSQSDWSIDKDESNYCNICDHTFKTTKAKNVHMLMKHSNTKEPIAAKSNLTPAKTLMDAKMALAATSSPGTWKRYGCQICTKRFNEFSKLRTHYTLYHFWDNLSEDYKFMGDSCNICMRKYPTEDHLIQHMGNFHCLIDKYLVKKGLRIISSEKTIKLLSWRCEFCKTNQTSSAALKSHLAVKHYQKELLAEFPVERGKNKRCPKCYKLFDNASVSTVIGHVGSFHDEVIKYATEVLDLDEIDKDNIPVDDFDDGTIGVPVEREESSLFKCEKCGSISKTRSDLKNHYLDQHYAGQFMTEYPVPFCSFCEQEYLEVALLHKHIVTKHETVFCSMLGKDGIVIPPLVSPRRRRQVIHKGTFDYLFCQICLQEFQSSKSLKVHYIRHYQRHFQAQYFTIKCTFCDKTFGDVMTTQKHIASDHDELSLIPLMETENLWVDKSVILEPDNAKLKRIGIPIKKVSTSIVKKHIDEIEEAKPQVEKNLNCAFPSCDRVSDSREKFLIHLAISHFWKDLTLEYGEAFEADSMHCPICKEKINPNSEKTAYYKHLAVAHETVMKYVQTIGREEPRVSTVDPSDGATNVPVIRFSNETVTDENETKNNSLFTDKSDFEIGNNLKNYSGSNGSSLANGSLVEKLPIELEEIKNEITTEDNLASVVNGDLMCKIRNVFSSDDDSDSD
eukprot:GFUD01043099.1.p1 GENE.GFUD01043099.1~~GFUD01043099.1.p1  ORF type:complete len:1056 (-),score=199.66 GFUD01043099.1:173-3037(-)